MVPSSRIVRISSLLRVVSGYKLRLEASYAGRLVGGERTLDPGEVLEARFFNPSDLPEGLLDTHRELIELAFAQQVPGSSNLSDWSA